MKKTTMDSAVKQAGIGILAACILTLMICGLMGWLVGREVLPIEAAPVWTIILSGVCLFVICLLTARKSARRRLPLSMVMAAVFSLICFLTKAALFPKAEFSWGWYTAVPFLAAVLAGVLASKRKTVRR